MKFENLVFEGGGVKGIAYAGALEELEYIGLFDTLKRVAGTSAGAITALLVALGYSTKEVGSIISSKDFNDFKDDNKGFIRDAIRLFRYFGWHKGRHFTAWIQSLIEKKSGKKHLTFQELHDSPKFLDLFIIGTNLSRQETEVYSYETTPNMPIAYALRISMSIPLYFQSIKKRGDVMVDGGVTANYPIKIFDYGKYQDSTKEKLVNPRTLGFRLDTKEEISYHKKGKGVPKKINSIFKYNAALLSFLFEVANKKHLSEEDWKRTIFIDTLGVKTTDFDLTKDGVEALIESGRYGVISHFSWRERKGMAPY